MEAHLNTSEIASLGDWSGTSPGVTLRVTETDARRIVRALEETSVRLGGSPSGSRLAGSYIRLAGLVRRQATT